jgi:RNA polymerase-binding transcription factor DksA
VARTRAVVRVSELGQVFDAIVESSVGVNMDDEHDPEGSTVGFERAQISALLDHARTQLAELDAALDRMRSGSYGICEDCGDQIPPARLEAHPAARVCIACALRR